MFIEEKLYNNYKYKLQTSEIFNLFRNQHNFIYAQPKPNFKETREISERKLEPNYKLLVDCTRVEPEKNVSNY